MRVNPLTPHQLAVKQSNRLEGLGDHALGWGHGVLGISNQNSRVVCHQWKKRSH